MMTPNPFLKKLGLSNTDRAVIIHADDIGMCQGTITAFQDLWEFGAISSGAVMVPCAWFPAAAETCRHNPQIDMGVHATFNSEWDGYRWGPLSTRDRASGLVDTMGYFPKEREPVYENASPEAVLAELEAQVECAFAAGIDVTHIDSHMGTIVNWKFVQSYLQAAMSRRLPNMLPRANAQGLNTMGIDATEFATYGPLLDQLESQGVPMLDGLYSMPLYDERGHVEKAKDLLGRIPSGISHFILHPCIDTPEVRAITTDWESRVANYQAFMSGEVKDFIQNAGIQLIGYRQIRNAMRS